MRTSNTFWFVLLIAGIGLMIAFLFTSDVTSAFDLLMMPLFSLVVAIPFAIAFSVLMIRLVSHIFMGVVYGTHQPAEKEKYGKAKVLIAAEKFEQAIAEYTKILEEFPEDVYSCEQIAEIYSERLKNYQSAAAEYNKVLEMKINESRTVSILNRLADLYGEHLGEREKAIESLERIISQYPDSIHSERAQMRLKEYKR